MVSDAKESTNQVGHFLDFHRFSWSYAGPKSNLHPRTEISTMASLTPKLSTVKVDTKIYFWISKNVKTVKIK